MDYSVDGKIPTIHIKHKYKNKRVHINGLHLNSMVCVSYYVPEKVRRGEHKIHEVNLKTDLLTETYLFCVLYYLLSVREIVEPHDQRMAMYMKKKHKVHDWNCQNHLCNLSERANNFSNGGKLFPVI